MEMKSNNKNPCNVDTVFHCNLQVFSNAIGSVSPWGTSQQEVIMTWNLEKNVTCLHNISHKYPSQDINLLFFNAHLHFNDMMLLHFVPYLIMFHFLSSE